MKFYFSPPLILLVLFIIVSIVARPLYLVMKYLMRKLRSRFSPSNFHQENQMEEKTKVDKETTMNRNQPFIRYMKEQP
ncbi:MAG: hypothetical protein GY861_08110 [bacterium]|nr:hypothetical protein [bacterium]